jgi:hypothetical protein
MKINEIITEGEVIPLGKKHRGDLAGTHSCVKCGGDLQGGTYMGHKVKVCMPCKQVYLPPNSGIDQQGNKIEEQGVEEGKTVPGLWANIHAKRKRGAKMRKKGAPGAPTEKALKAAQAGSKNESVGEDSGSLNEFAITPDDGPDDGVQAGRWLVTYMVKNGITKEKIMVGKNANTVAKYFEFKYRRKPLSVVPYFDDMDLRGQLGLDEQGVAEAAGSPSFRKGQKVLIVKQGVIATVTKIDKKWGYITVQTNDGRMAQIDERQFNQIKAYHGPMLSPSVTSEITELLNNGTSPDDVADIMSLPVEVVAEFMPNQQGVTEGSNGEYDDESGMAETNLHTIARAAKGLLDTIDSHENLPEWVQEKIAKVEGMMVTAWDYLKSQEEQGVDPRVGVAEDWQKTNKQDKTDGMSSKAVKAYRRENPGSKLKTAVTTKPSKLKAGSKDAKRRDSFCARMSGNKGPMKDEKGRPTPKAKALKRWNCNEDTGD